MEKNIFEVIEDVLIIKLDNELDHHNAELLREEIDRMIDIEEIKNVVFDFSHVNFMDSSGIGVIMGRYRKVYYIGGKVFVIGISKMIDRIFLMSGLYKIVTKVQSIEEVLGD